MDVQAGRISVQLSTEVPAQRQQLITKHHSYMTTARFNIRLRLLWTLSISEYEITIAGFEQKGWPAKARSGDRGVANRLQYIHILSMSLAILGLTLQASEVLSCNFATPCILHHLFQIIKYLETKSLVFLCKFW
jgi:hypothetical protein